MRGPFFFFLLGLAMAAFNAKAASFQINEPIVDRWMYPFAVGGGSQGAIQTFGVIGNSDFDNRDGQMFLRFNTTGILAAGLGVANYQLSSLKLTLTLSSDGTIYDPTSDLYSTYLPGGSDADMGRPVELFGVGYRNGVTSPTFNENSTPFAPNGGTTGKGIRSAYAAGYNAAGQLIDVSNNVDNGFEAAPWSVGQVAGAASGSALSMDSDMTFTFDLSNAFVLAYLQSAFNQGYLDLMITSLYGASQPGMGTQPNFPVFYAKENALQDANSGDPSDLLAGRLSGNVSAVPEPATIVLLLLAAMVAVGFRGMRRA